MRFEGPTSEYCLSPLETTFGEPQSNYDTVRPEGIAIFREKSAIHYESPVQSTHRSKHFLEILVISQIISFQFDIALLQPSLELISTELPGDGLNFLLAGNPWDCSCDNIQDIQVVKSKAFTEQASNDQSFLSVYSLLKSFTHLVRLHLVKMRPNFVKMSQICQRL